MTLGVIRGLPQRRERNDDRGNGSQEVSFKVKKYAKTRGYHVLKKQNGNLDKKGKSTRRGFKGSEKTTADKEWGDRLAFSINNRGGCPGKIKIRRQMK